MIAAGCDVGSLTAKAVILKDDHLIAAKIINAKSKPENSAGEVMGLAIKEAGIAMQDIEYCVATGYGRKQISFVDDAKSEIACHARGAHHLLPNVRTVIDIGGQDCKVARIDENGKVVNFITNDKCAAGTGRFLEVMAEVLEISLDDLGKVSERARNTVALASLCTVWAQAEVIRYINEDIPVSDIVSSINQAMAGRVGIIAKSVGLEKDVCMTGGVTKNKGVLKSLQSSIGVKIKKPGMDPQLVGALGAAIFAEDTLKKGGIKS